MARRKPLKRKSLRPDQLVERYALRLSDVPSLSPAIDAIYARSSDTEVRLEALQQLAYRTGHTISV